eukprot:scaffold63425_cov56-Attheya_sp.AAC.3
MSNPATDDMGAPTSASSLDDALLTQPIEEFQDKEEKEENSADMQVQAGEGIDSLEQDIPKSTEGTDESNSNDAPPLNGQTSSSLLDSSDVVTNTGMEDVENSKSVLSTSTEDMADALPSTSIPEKTNGSGDTVFVENGNATEVTPEDLNPVPTDSTKVDSKEPLPDAIKDDMALSTEASSQDTNPIAETAETGSKEKEDDTDNKDSNNDTNAVLPRSSGRTRSASIDGRDETRSSRDTSRETSAGDVVIATLGEVTSEIGTAVSSVIAGIGGIAKESTGATATATSFLEALTEEERRTRTRHLPHVEGFRMLYKSEIKRDLSLARATMYPTNGLNTLAPSKSGRGKRKISSEANHEKAANGDVKDMMEIDEDEISDAESISDTSISGIATSFVPGPPTGAFMPPVSESKGMEGGEDGSNFAQMYHGGDGDENAITAPNEVESITAFNPPRPPESVGPKKKHRMIRWERNPQDVEIDLSSYRKTVQRTRTELHAAEEQREKIETFGAILRGHFESHLKAIREESILLNQESNLLQNNCIKAAELQTSQTRSRGVGKGGIAMRDVISVLKTRSEKSSLSGLTESSADVSGLTQSSADVCPSGIGGVSAVSFREGSISASRTPALATSWILPGDKVSTPYGKGVVLHLFGHDVLDVDKAPPTSILTKARLQKHAIDVTPNSASGAIATDGKAQASSPHGFGGSPNTALPPSKSGASDDSSKPNKHNLNEALPGVVASSETGGANPIISPAPQKAVQAKKGKQASRTKSPKQKAPTKSLKVHVLVPRICVRLPFGIGFFCPETVTSLEKPSSYSDAMLAQRWKNMVATAKLMGCCVDVAAMGAVLDSTMSDFAATSSSGYASSSASQQSGKGNTGTDGDISEANSERPDVSAGAKGDMSAFDPIQENSIVDPHIVTNDNTSQISGDDVGMEIEEEGKSSLMADMNDAKGIKPSRVLKRCLSESSSNRRLVPFGSRMLPTPGIRGAALAQLPLSLLEKNLDLIRGGVGVHGKPHKSPCIPPGMIEWEADRHEMLSLKGKVLQRRNELYRQRRIRILNERSYIAGTDRTQRVEGLLVEMKADLQSLKERLQDDLVELGIDNEKADDMLAAHYAAINKRNNGSNDTEPDAKRLKTEDESSDGPIGNGENMELSTDQDAEVNPATSNTNTGVPIATH